jgi:hypothetical protein
VIDGEAVVLDIDSGGTGDADFDALHSGRYNHEIRLYTFNMLA